MLEYRNRELCAICNGAVMFCSIISDLVSIVISRYRVLYYVVAMPMSRTRRPHSLELAVGEGALVPTPKPAAPQSDRRSERVAAEAEAELPDAKQRRTDQEERATVPAAAGEVIDDDQQAESSSYIVVGTAAGGEISEQHVDPVQPRVLDAQEAAQHVPRQQRQQELPASSAPPPQGPGRAHVQELQQAPVTLFHGMHHGQRPAAVQQHPQHQYQQMPPGWHQPQHQPMPQHQYQPQPQPMPQHQYQPQPQPQQQPLSPAQLAHMASINQQFLQQQPHVPLTGAWLGPDDAPVVLTTLELVELLRGFRTAIDTIIRLQGPAHRRYLAAFVLSLLTTTALHRAIFVRIPWLDVAGAELCTHFA